jgi:hypothetical protein
MVTFAIKFGLYVIILTLLVILLTKEGFKQSTTRLKNIDPRAMYKSRTQEFEANAQLRGNLIDYFDGYLMNEIKFNSPRVSMDKWAANQKKQDIKRAVEVSTITGELGYV